MLVQQLVLELHNPALQIVPLAGAGCRRLQFGTAADQVGVFIPLRVASHLQYRQLPRLIGQDCIGIVELLAKFNHVLPGPAAGRCGFLQPGTPLLRLLQLVLRLLQLPGCILKLHSEGIQLLQSQFMFLRLVGQLLTGLIPGRRQFVQFGTHRFQLAFQQR